MFNNYLIRAGNTNFYKIGYTKKDPTKRLKELQTGNAEALELVFNLNNEWGKILEQTLHRSFKTRRCKIESSHIGEEETYTEWFEFEPEFISEVIAQYKKTADNLKTVFETRKNYYNLL